MAEAKAKSAPEQDPSMEEILQSIRRIIAEEDKEAPTAAKTEAGGYNVSGMDISSDVLELTEMAEEPAQAAVNGKAAEAPPVVATVYESPVDVLANIDSALSEPASGVLNVPEPAASLAADDFGMEEEAVETKIIPAPAVKAPEVTAPQYMPEEVQRLPASSLVSEQTASVASSALRKVSQSRPAPETHASYGLAFRSGTTVEELVVEAIRPLLKEWLDMNLAGIVERIVDREVKRLASDD